MGHMDLDHLERRLVDALVSLIKNSKGKVVSIRAASLAKMTGYGSDHRTILRAARLLKRLSRQNLVRANTEGLGKNRSYRYVLDENSELWRLVRSNPTVKAKELLAQLIKNS
ncbi:RepB family plasmid replication initiator protein [Thermoproteus uzoniensis]|uniref:RepB family plasmid replication initiator protein n=1 Tax=Thermoproteus uzoniensis TaxID=184117 RepID=UPI0030B864E0